MKRWGEERCEHNLIIIFSTALKASEGLEKVGSDQLTAQGPIEW